MSVICLLPLLFLWMEGVEVALERRETSRSEVEENARYRDRNNWREIIKCLPADRH